jgi:hypothetical protein
MVGIGGTLGALAGAGNAVPGVIDNFIKQQQALDQFQSNQIIGELFQKNPNFFSQMVPGASPMPGGKGDSSPDSTGPPGGDSSAGGSMVGGMFQPGPESIQGPAQTAQAQPQPQQPAQTPAATVQQRFPQQAVVPGATPMPQQQPQQQPVQPQPQQPQQQPQQPRRAGAMKRGGGDEGAGKDAGGAEGSKAMQLMQTIRSSPTAMKNPRALGMALTQLLPLMSKQEQQYMLQEYRMMQLENAQQRIGIQQQNADSAQQRIGIQQQQLLIKQNEVALRENRFKVQQAFRESIANGRLKLAEDRFNEAVKKNDFQAKTQAIAAVNREIALISQMANAGVDPKDPTVAPKLQELNREIEDLRKQLYDHMRTIDPSLAGG